MFAIVSIVSEVIGASPWRVFSQVQSFMRGWLCRRKWKIIVQDYICSPHAESMRKRNQIVFNMVEAETEYVLQLSILVNCFLRPLRMAASSKKPPIRHDDVSSIFLNRYNSRSNGQYCGGLFPPLNKKWQNKITFFISQIQTFFFCNCEFIYQSSEFVSHSSDLFFWNNVLLFWFLVSTTK